ncbi:MAG: hypothetical protein ACTSU5_12235 [Promethearchaeota archaeon]
MEAPKKILPERKRYLEKYEDVRKQWRDAIVGAFIAVILVFVINYVVSYFEDNALTGYIQLMEVYSGGQGINEVLGFWALSFTPISALNQVAPTWMDNWYLYLAPILVAGIVIAISTKSFKYSMIGGIWFILWAIILPLTFVIILPLFSGISFMETVNPMSVNAMLISIFQDTLATNQIVTFFKILTGSPFLGWCFGGALELGAVVILFAIPFGAIFSILKSVIKGHI